MKPNYHMDRPQADASAMLVTGLQPTLGDAPQTEAREGLTPVQMPRRDIKYVFQCHGDSMLPRIQDGDYVGVGEALGRYEELTPDEHGNYFVAGETSWQARDIRLPLSFLPAGAHTANIMVDGVNADHVATDYKVKTQQVTSSTTLDIHMASGGGFVIAIEK